MSIVDYAIPWQGPLIAPMFTNDPWAVHAAPYWSSTPYAGGSGPAWMVSFVYGDVETYTKSVGWYIRCVRGGQKPGPILTDKGNGTVTDSRTGLVWDQAIAVSKTWGAALSCCEGKNLGGKSDWRLPNVKELEVPGR